MYTLNENHQLFPNRRPSVSLVAKSYFLSRGCAEARKNNSTDIYYPVNEKIPENVKVQRFYLICMFQRKSQINNYTVKLGRIKQVANKVI